MNFYNRRNVGGELSTNSHISSIDVSSQANRSWWLLIRITAEEWVAGDILCLGAALSFYAVFSLAPLLVIALGIVGVFFPAGQAHEELLAQIREQAGPKVTEGMEQMIAATETPTEGALATVVGFLVLLIGASGVFGQLQSALNIIWGVQSKHGRGLWPLLWDRFLSFSLVLGSGFLLLASLVLSTALSAASKWLSGTLPLPAGSMFIAHFCVSTTVITVLFAGIFKFVPNAKIAWKDVWLGAFATSLLFSEGKYLMGMYLGRTAVDSAYGAAASIMLVLLWVYCVSQLVLLGALFTQVYARMYGSHATPIVIGDKP